MQSKPTVYIVDDDPAVIKGLAELVELIELKAEAYPSADAFLEAYQPSGPACLVLDVRMPGLSGLELQNRLAERDAQLPIIFITGHAEVRMAVEAMKNGAVDFFEKPVRMQELCDGIQRVIRVEEENWCRRTEQRQAQQKLDQLTPAERKVMDLVVAGKTNRMIADELALSTRAVEDRRARMMKKLQAESRSELLALAAAAQGR